MSFHRIARPVKIGCIRVSTGEQSHDVQVGGLEEAGCEKIFNDPVSGTSAGDSS